jgi:hypothetical protein
MYSFRDTITLTPVLRGGGCVVGRVDDKGQLTGIRIGQT